MKFPRSTRPCLAFLLSSTTCRRVFMVHSFSNFRCPNRSPSRLFAKMSQTSLPTSFPPLIDVDCNLWHRDLKSLQINKDQSAATAATWTMLQEDAIQQANIVAMLSPSSTLQEAKQGLQLLQEPPPPLPIRTTVGVHPYHVQDDELQGISWQEHQEAIKDLVQTADNLSLIAAIGECGLDASEGFPPLEEQLPWFAMQIAVAQELQLPLFVHERLAFRECIQLLEEVTVPVIIHCFTGTQEECAEYVQRGYSISVSGYILKDSNDNCSEVLSCLEQGIIPLDKLMIETDAPYMGFDGCRHLYLEHNSEFVASLNSKKRKRLQQSIYPNVPSSLPMVLQKVTECLQKNDASLTLEAVAEATTVNAQSFFGLSV